MESVLEMNLFLFSADRGINQKRTENCINGRNALLRKFSVLFSVDTSINRKNIRIISYHLNLIAFQEEKQPYLNHAEIFPTFNVVEIHMTSQSSFFG